MTSTSVIGHGTQRIAAFCAAVPLAIVGGWCLLTGRIPELDDEEWPYVGYAEAQRKRATGVVRQRSMPVQNELHVAA